LSPVAAEAARATASADATCAPVSTDAALPAGRTGNCSVIDERFKPGKAPTCGARLPLAAGAPGAAISPNTSGRAIPARGAISAIGARSSIRTRTAWLSIGSVDAVQSVGPIDSVSAIQPSSTSRSSNSSVGGRRRSSQVARVCSVRAKAKNLREPTEIGSLACWREQEDRSGQCNHGGWECELFFHGRHNVFSFRRLVFQKESGRGVRREQNDCGIFFRIKRGVHPTKRRGVLEQLFFVLKFIFVF
jgi:hypothetical protein